MTSSIASASTGTGYRILQVVSALELVSLAVILTNRFTIQSPAITSTGGPVHGLLYISTILLALLLPLPRAAKWLAVVPAIGGILALTVARLRRTDVIAAPAARLRERHVTTVGADTLVHADGFTKQLSPTVTIGPLDFVVPRGRITGMIGPNGAGKTTTLRAIAGLVQPTAGAITIGGRSPLGDPDVLESVGVLIEGPAFVDSLSALDNLLVLTQLAGWPDDSARIALGRVGLTELASRRVSTFSLGMRQRLGLAAALLGDPALVILDEPTNGLDPQGSETLRRFLLELAAAGTTLIVSSHILTDIEQVCDHLVVLSAGSVVFEGAPAELSSIRPNTVRYRVAPGDAAGAERLRDALGEQGIAVAEGADAGEASVSMAAGSATSGSAASGSAASGSAALGDAASGSAALGSAASGSAALDAAAINRIAIDIGVVLSELRTVRPSLQEIFFDLTGRPDASIGLNPVVETAPAGRLETAGAAR